mmetsp:Transcript_20816/g.42847  ORF Transcript_20816/g.42847 Transcript_20816/m.42847 type:complete len:315 (-) Transcript_20816:856-1800(-)
MTFCLASMIRRIARHFPQDGLQQRIHSWGSLEVQATERFFPRVSVGRRDSYCSLHWRRLTQTRRCLRVRASAADSGVWGASYSSSGAEQRARSGSLRFMEQYHFLGSLLWSTTPRRRLHFLHLSHSTQVELEAPVVWPKMLPSSRSMSTPLSNKPMFFGLPASANPLGLSSIRKQLEFVLVVLFSFVYWLRPFFLFLDNFFLLPLVLLLVLPSSFRMPSSSLLSSTMSPSFFPARINPAPPESPKKHPHFLAACNKCARSRRIDCPLYMYWCSSSSESVSRILPLALYWSSSRALRICSWTAIWAADNPGRALR